MSKVQCITKEDKVINFTEINAYPKDGGHLADYCFIQSEMNHMLGEVLTIIDASMIGQQNKAIKDLVKGIFIKEYVKLTGLMHTKEDLEDMTSVDHLSEEELKKITEVDEDEALGLK